MSNRPPDISSRPLSAAANSPPNSKPVKRPCAFFQNAASALPQKPPTQTDTVASGHAMDAEQPCFAIQAADPKMQSVAANTPASAPSSRAAGV